MTDIDTRYFTLKAAAWNYQIKDSITLNQKKYDIEIILPNISNWFLPDFNGFEPCYRIPACWRGYQCDYVIKDKLLYLVNLNINDKNNNYPIFMDREPDLFTPTKYFKATYREIFHNFKFTGKIIVVRNLLTDKLSYIKKAELWMYEEILELHFKNGKLTRLVNKTNELKMIKELEEIMYNDFIKGSNE